jgi:hypothetical protein
MPPPARRKVLMSGVTNGVKNHIRRGTNRGERVCRNPGPG